MTSTSFRALAFALCAIPFAATAQKIPASGLGSHPCDGGSLRGTSSAESSPEENVNCKVLGRVYCMVAEQRALGMPAEVAISRTSDSLNRVGRTGSHTVANTRPLVEGAAAHVYAEQRLLPWTAYFYAVYSCGLNLRVTDPELRRKAAPVWDSLAGECLRQFPGEGEGYVNDKLRSCLDAAMAKAASPGK